MYIVSERLVSHPELESCPFSLSAQVDTADEYRITYTSQQYYGVALLNTMLMVAFMQDEEWSALLDTIHSLIYMFPFSWENLDEPDISSE